MSPEWVPHTSPSLYDLRDDYDVIVDDEDDVVDDDHDDEDDEDDDDYLYGSV